MTLLLVSLLRSVCLEGEDSRTSIRDLHKCDLFTRPGTLSSSIVYLPYAKCVQHLPAFLTWLRRIPLLRSLLDSGNVHITALNTTFLPLSGILRLRSTVDKRAGLLRRLDLFVWRVGCTTLERM